MLVAALPLPRPLDEIRAIRNRADFAKATVTIVT
jgi:hypothetical protein